MADEHDPTEPDETGTEPEEVAATADHAARDETAEPADPEVDDVQVSLDDVRRWVNAATAADNEGVLGELRLCFPSRDVTFVIDGDAGIRTLALLSGSADRTVMDELDARMSTARRGWIMVERAELMAASWFPLTGREVPSRITVDPTP